MIFEVESSATSGVASNATKVFGQINEEFEKPLFFFHVIVRGGQDTSRLDAARGEFGRHNYRHYRLALGERKILLRDILLQNRRLSQAIDLSSVVPALMHPQWQSVEIEEILCYIEDAQYVDPRGSFLPTYGLLTGIYPQFQSQFTRYLHKLDGATQLSRVDLGYQTYIGRQWAEPIHIGILAASSGSEHRERYLDRLRDWQEHSTFLPMIGPFFGQARDYDEFIIHLAGPLWALIAALLRDLPQAGRYIAGQYKDILAEMQSRDFPPHITVPTAQWMLLIAASALAEEEFELARHHINGAGGLPEGLLYQPLSVPEPDQVATFEKAMGKNSRRIGVPVLQEYISTYRTSVLNPEDRQASVVSLGIAALVQEGIWINWSPTLVNLLLHDYL